MQSFGDFKFSDYSFVRSCSTGVWNKHKDLKSLLDGTFKKILGTDVKWNPFWGSNVCLSSVIIIISVFIRARIYSFHPPILIHDS